MSSYKKLEIKRFPRVSTKDEKESAFWDKFKHPVVAKEYGTITRINFSQASPHDFAVTAGTRVQIYSSTTSRVKKTISRFKKTAYCAKFRHDGLLLAAGGEECVLRVFDLNSRAILRQLKGHAKSVKCIDFTTDGLGLVSGSDDTSVRLWDMATGTTSRELRGHTDYVRAVSANPSSDNVILSGSYDHTVRLWDVRSDSVPLVLDHGSPVEALLVFPSGSSCISAGGNYIKVWDLLSGGRLVAGFSNHQKTITSLGFDGSCQRLLSGGLDRQLKIYDLETYNVKHNILYSAPILSLAMSPTDNCLVVGMTAQLLSIRHYSQTPPTSSNSSSTFPLFDLPHSRPHSFRPKPGTYRYFIRGKNAQPTEDDYVVKVGRKPRLKLYDKHLKAFRFKKALDSVLELKPHPQRPSLVYSLLQEMARMDGLMIALSGRNEEELLPLLKYLRKHLINPRYTSLLTDVCSITLDIYGSTCFTSKSVKEQFSALLSQINHELRYQRKAFEIMGMIDTLLTASVVTNRTVVDDAKIRTEIVSEDL